MKVDKHNSRYLYTIPSELYMQLSKPTKMNVGKPFRLIDFKTFDSTASSIRSSQAICSSDEEDSDSSDKKYEPCQFLIQMFGVNEQGQTCSIIVDDFRPFFFLRVNDYWNQGTVNIFIQELVTMTGQPWLKKQIVSATLVEYHKLYGFSAGKKDRFIQVVCLNQTVFNRIKNLWYKKDRNNNRRLTKIQFQGTRVEIYESNIPPLLRYFHIQNISPSGWVSVMHNRAYKPELKTTPCTYEYVCSKKHIIPLPEKETRVPYKIMSFDIEASSSHGDFPLPQKTYKKLAQNIVDAFLKNFSDPKTADPEFVGILIRKCILTAFGHDCFDDVDVVYPKRIPTIERINNAINLLLTTSLEHAETMASDDGEDKNKLLTISAMFDKIRDRVIGESGGPRGGDDEDEDDEPDADPEAEERDEEEEEYIAPAYISGVQVETTYTMIDLLLSENYTRDAKIIRIDETLTRLFPALKGDEVTFIGSTFMRYGESEPYLNHCFAVGTCDPVVGCTIETTKTERQMLEEWAQLVNREDPDIIIGYNIFGFDYEFMFRRALETGCAERFLQLSRRNGELCVKDQPFHRGPSPAMEIDHTTIALASGDYDLNFIKMTGRLQIDMYMYLRREYNFGSYKLDDMASYFISDDIKRVEVVHEEGQETMTRLYSKNLMGLHVGDFIHIEITSFTSDYYADGAKFIVQDILYNQPMVPTKPADDKKNQCNVIIVRGDHGILSTYKNIKWGMAKDDVSPQDIFRLTKGSSADRGRVAKYCVQDCNLVHHLLNKVDVITGYIEMSSICNVPISFLVFRGQGIKLQSYVAKKCREKQTLMPDLDKTGGNEGYEGAIVLPPKCSMYMDNPVACVDYASLYPSSMISQNYSHDSKVWTREFDLSGNLIREWGEKDRSGNYKYDNLPGYQYINIEFDTYRYVRKTPTSAAVKTKAGTMVCRWAQFPNDKKGIMPSILEELLKARSDTRKKAKVEPDPFMQNVLDKRQLGYKVTANSLYGQCGAKTSSFYEKDVAASTTATGRMMITYARRIIEEVYGDRVYATEKHGMVLTKAEYVYGDSVANYTPVYVKCGNKVDICTIDSLAEKYGIGDWAKCMEEGKQEKEVCEMRDGVETWTDKGWTKLHRVIRHTLAPTKKMVRVLTHTGLVDCTDDHSLLKDDGTEISPNDCCIGTQLMHNNLPSPTIFNTHITEDEARVMGFFFGDGSCGMYSCLSGEKKSWALNNDSLERIQYYLELCKKAYPQHNWVYLNTLESSGVYKIVPKNSEYGSISKFVSSYRKMMYKNNNKIIPTEILHAPENIRIAFWNGLYDADGDKTCPTTLRIDQKSQLSSANIVMLAQSLGYKVSLNARSDKPDIFRMNLTKGEFKKHPCAIKKINNIDYEGYVYDLTTENHHFAAGVGNMIVHNTDSVFFTFNLHDPTTGEPIRGKKALEITIEIAQDAAHLCTRFLKPPMELSYEKTLMPFVLLKKKRYVGMLYETDPEKGKLKYMGLSLKRRDSCDYLKDVYGGILNILMKENDLMKSIDFLNTSLERLVLGQVPMDKLTITRALSSYYKNPKSIAHAVLAERIAKRDPGNKPKPGDRLKYLFFENPGAKLQGDKIELPEYIVAEGLKVDYAHYIERQLMKPLQQLYGLALEQIWDKQKKLLAIKTHKKDVAELRKKYPDQETFAKKHDEFCSKKVKPLLFDKWLIQINNKRNNVQDISSFFVKPNK